MITSTQFTTPDDITAEALVIGLFEPAVALDPATQAIDEVVGGVIHALAKTGDFTGKCEQTAVLYTFSGKIKRLVLVGLGKPDDLTLERLRRAYGKAALATRELGVKSMAVLMREPGDGPLKAEACAQASAEGTLLALYQMNEYRTRKLDTLKAIDEVAFVSTAQGDDPAIRAGVATAEVLAESVRLTRDLVAHPSNVMTPSRLAAEAVRLSEETGLKVTVLEKETLEDMGFGGLLAVNQGSSPAEPAKFIILEWAGGPAGEKPVAIVGKGITFDTGGISIKPGAGMELMKYDMGGAAAALGIMRAVAKLGLERNVVGLIPTTENMPSSTALKPGDVITTYSGQTVEIINTDAEGRLILCDALTYAVKDLQAQAVIDMATLTGACAIALGHVAVGVLGNHQVLVDRALSAGQRSGDRGWQLPLWEDYDELVDSDIADMKNSAGREAGTITAACFLNRFVGDTPWVHLDIAGTAWTEKSKSYRPKGPTGVPVRLVIDLLRGWIPLEQRSHDVYVTASVG